MKSAILTFLFASFSISSCLSQQADSLNFEKLNSKKLIKLLEENNFYTLKDLNGIEEACFTELEDSSLYSYHTKDFLIEAGIDKVWEVYKSASPTQIKGKKHMVGFGMLYAEDENKIYYPEDPFKAMEVGQTVFWNLRVWGGLFKISVGQTVTRIDEDQKLIEICYLVPGISHGSQFIRLYPTDEGFTRIEHYTFFKSDSRFRDRRIYPGLHEKAITEYHEGIRSLSVGDS